MNLRTKLIDAVEELTDNAEIIDLITDFVNNMESKFEEISTLLSDVRIDSLDNIVEAQDLAKKMEDDLY